jgi:hypothetical protein
MRIELSQNRKVRLETLFKNVIREIGNFLFFQIIFVKIKLSNIVERTKYDTFSFSTTL